MRNPVIITPSIAASGTERQKGTINLYRTDDLWVTTRVTYNASATSGVTLNAY